MALDPKTTSPETAVTATSGIVRRVWPGFVLVMKSDRSHRDFRNREAVLGEGVVDRIL
jgi:hypothetical protein